MFKDGVRVLGGLSGMCTIRLMFRVLFVGGAVDCGYCFVVYCC